MFAGFTGIDAVYEPPSKPDLVLRAGVDSITDCVEKVTEFLKQKASLIFFCIPVTFHYFFLSYFAIGCYQC